MSLAQLVDIDGIAWSVRLAGTGRPLLLLHGFTGSGRTWDGLVACLGGRWAVIAPDLPGHGRTGWRRPDGPGLDAPDASVEASAVALASLLGRLAAGPADVLGYSLGARIALRLAIVRPDLVRGLVLEAPSAGIPDPTARAARRAADEARAARLHGDGLAAFVEAWEQEPTLAAGEARLSPAARAALRDIRSSHDPAGLAASLRAAGQGAMQPLHRRLGQVRAPTLVLVGEDDPVRDRSSAVAAGIARARLALIPGAGHAPHLEAPAAFCSLVVEFLTEVAP